MAERVARLAAALATVGVLVCSIGAVRTARAQSVEIGRGLWSAEWITSRVGPQRDAEVLRFRKVIELATKPEHFLVDVSADNQFAFYVNRQRVGTGPSKSDLAHWRYEAYDIAPFLHPGKNVLGATVWNFGVLTPLAQISDRIGFLLRGEGEAERAADTNSSWEVQEERGITVLPTPDEVRRHYYVSEPAERIDGTSLDWDWDANEVENARRWRTAETIGRATVRGSVLQENNWQLVKDPLPSMEMNRVEAGHVARATGVAVATGAEDVAFHVDPNSTATVLLDAGHLMTAYPEITLDGGRDATVRLTYAEALVNEKGEKGNRNQIAGKHIEGIFDEFVADGASGRVYAPLAWKTWRYLQIDVTTEDQPLDVKKVGAWFTAYPFEERGKFASNDVSLAPIWDIGWRTARMDAHDTYMDTPYYERMQYIGDTRIQALISYTVAGDDRLARQAISAFNDSRIPDGITKSRWPSSVTQVIPTFSLLWVGMVHDYWMYQNDPEFVRAQLTGTRAVLDWFMARQRADGMMGKISWWPFADWGNDFDFGSAPEDADGGSSIITLQFVAALREAAEMERALGDPGQAALYDGAAERASQGVMKLCWNEKYGLLADTPAQQHFSQHANILGVWQDAIARARQKNVLSEILSVSDPGSTSVAGSGRTGNALPPMTQATYYFRFYLARAIEHAGMGDEYLKLLGPWHTMVSMGLTTWAEQPEPTRSDSHAWSAHPNYDFLTIVAGIRPGAPGFASVEIEPHLGTLKHLKAAMPSPKGMIEAEYTVTSAGVTAAITLPEGLAGKFLWKGAVTELRPGAQEIQLPLK
ncbi:MAG: alpha-L-rhamnosidase C-terminal domain-containing protein [Candidatus Acidiferrales bacterium]